MGTLSFLRIFYALDYRFGIFYWLIISVVNHYLFQEITMDPYSFSRIHFEFIFMANWPYTLNILEYYHQINIFFVNSLWMHNLSRLFTINHQRLWESTFDPLLFRRFHLSILRIQNGSIIVNSLLIYYLIVIFDPLIISKNNECFNGELAIKSEVEVNSQIKIMDL